MFEKVTDVRATRRWLFAALIAYVLCGFNLAITMMSERTWIFFVFLAGECAFGLALWMLPRRLHGRTHADGSGVYVGGRMVASRQSIHSAYVLERDGRSWVRLVRRLGQVDIAVDAPHEEAALLQALRLDAAGVVARYLANVGRQRAGARRFALILLIPFVAVALMIATVWLRGRIADWLIFPLFVILAAHSALSLRALERVYVGADGIRLRRLPITSRFVPFSSMQNIAVDGLDIVLTLSNDETIVWHVPRLTSKSQRRYFTALAQRISRGLEAHRATTASESAGMLARGSRSIEAWVRDVRVATDPEHAKYRVAIVPPEELWKTVESASAVPTARAGAAVALQRVLDDAGRKRLRDIAATCASETLRLALEAAADDERLEPHLEALAD